MILYEKRRNEMNMSNLEVTSQQGTKQPPKNQAKYIYKAVIKKR